MAATGEVTVRVKVEAQVERPKPPATRHVTQLYGYPIVLHALVDGALVDVSKALEIPNALTGVRLSAERFLDLIDADQRSRA